jgi:uncharacterized membrane protein YdjX (TVP38/TMEM64 family)
LKDVRLKTRYIISIAVVAGLVLLGVVFNRQLSGIITILSDGSLEEVVAMIKGWGMLAPAISMSLMVLQAFIAPIPSFLITGANGIIFGFYWGVAVSWAGAMLGAAGTFYLARLLGADFVRKFERSSGLVKKVDEISQKHGAKVIFIGRLLPFVSFDFLSYAAGLSTLKPIPFLLATALGMIPGTIAYVFLGNQILALSRYSGTITIIAIVVVLFLLGISQIRRWRKRRRHSKGLEE